MKDTCMKQLLCYAVCVSQTFFFFLSLIAGSHSFNGVQLNKAKSSTQKGKEIQYKETMYRSKVMIPLPFICSPSFFSVFIRLYYELLLLFACVFFFISGFFFVLCNIKLTLLSQLCKHSK